MDIKNTMKKLRPMDYMIVGIIIFIAILGILMVMGKKVYSPTPVLNEGKVTYDIFFKGVLITGEDAKHNPFKVGDEASVTVRNEPHAKLKIVDVKYQRKQVMVPTGSTSNPYVLVEDMENPCSYDFLITVEDTAKFTEDGLVSAGNKVKVGLPITLEGPEYRLNGIVSSFRIIDLKNSDDE